MTSLSKSAEVGMALQRRTGGCSPENADAIRSGGLGSSERIERRCREGVRDHLAGPTQGEEIDSQVVAQLEVMLNRLPSQSSSIRVTSFLYLSVIHSRNCVHWWR